MKIANYWDISLLRSFTQTINEGSSFHDIFFKPDGTKMYIVNNGEGAVRSYDLSVPWNIGTALYDGGFFYLGPPDNNYFQSLFFKSDGTKMYTTSFTLTAGSGKINSYTLSTPWNISSASYDGSYSITQATYCGGLSFKPDGTKMFILTWDVDRIFSYTLSTPWNISTASYDGIDFNVTSQDGVPWGLFFKPDGTRTYMSGHNSNRIYQYDSSTEWNLSTASYNNINFNDLIFNKPSGIYFKNDGKLFFVCNANDNVVSSFRMSIPWDISSAYKRKFFTSSQEGSILTIFLKPDGTKLYLAGFDQKKIYQYTLLIPWDVSTAVYDNKFADVSIETYPNQIWFKPDGTRMFIVGPATDKVIQYNLSTPWDVSTSSSAGDFSIGAQDNSGQGVTFKPDGTKMFFVGEDSKRVYSFTLSTPWDVTTASYDGLSYLFSAQDSNPMETHFDPSGTKMYMLGYANSRIYYYTLSTPWNVSTISYTNKFFSLVPDGLSGPRGLYVSPDGSNVYVATGDKVVWIDLVQ